jgi:hypothetical protein
MNSYEKGDILYQEIITFLRAGGGSLHFTLLHYQDNMITATQSA